MGVFVTLINFDVKGYNGRTVKTLTNTIEKLKNNPDVDAVFVTGSMGTSQEKPYSDIDLVIILNENIHNLYAFYCWIDGKFADIFFFDKKDLGKPLPMLVDWIIKGHLFFDKSGLLSTVKKNIDLAPESEATVDEQDKITFWRKINYNLVANNRYFNSGDPLYLKALDIRLLYSINELICGYLAFRNITWRGEKKAVSYLEENTPDFYSNFVKFSNAADLKSRFEAYLKMTDLVFPEGFKKWTDDEQIVLGKDFSLLGDDSGAGKYAREII